MKNGGTQDFSKVDPKPNKTRQPTIDDPSQRKAASRLFQSNDDVLHFSRSAGLRIK